MVGAQLGRDRREVRVYRALPGGSYAPPLALPLPLSVLSLEAGPPGTPVVALTDSARTVLAGILLIFPGVVSDLIALTLLLLPGPRVVAEPAPRREHGTFIEGEFRRTR